ncbi:MULTISPECIES: DUF4430 domain-containing protein [Exiguobacterium]|uniref:Transcobalamin-like C-terminal domain-containing protein n=1 Tax=Exiguobacterium aurantiacum TaxID=33987 RepID=A0A377FSW8_9BACL|nr:MULTISPECIES: DUF4430 domain-containing protein [Exiguobacterium]MCC5893237.1 DUF4430 domain-containing protein [Exiguobacterium sp.]STO07921.1 Uncharacterised protein [Exiguobacterium aurantiacum]
MKRLLTFSLLIPLLTGCADSTSTGTDGDCAVEPTVSVYNAATEETLFHEKSVCLEAGATVLDALQATELDIESVGSGDMTYVTAIDGVEEKSAGQSSGWVYAFNGSPGDEGAGAKEVESEDIIQWRFEEDAISFFE